MKRSLILLCIIFLAVVAAEGSQNLYKKNIFVQGSQNIVRINFFYPKTSAVDSLIIFQYSFDDVLTKPKIRNYANSIKAGRTGNGWFKFELKPLETISKYSYIEVYQLATPQERKNHETAGQQSDLQYEMMPFYLVKNGDNLIVKVYTKAHKQLRFGYRRNFSFKFFGKGELMQNLRFKIDSIAYQFVPDAMLDSSLTYNTNNYENRTIKSCLEYLDKFKKELSNVDYLQLKSYIIFYNKSEECIMLRHLNRKSFSLMTEIQKCNFVRSFDSLYLKFKRDIPLRYCLNSKEFPETEYQISQLQAILKNDINSPSSIYNTIKSKYSGDILDHVLVNYFNNSPGNIDSVRLFELLSKVRSPVLKKFLLEVSNKLPGKQAYNFSLPDTNGNLIQLSDYKGKIILIDFWYTGCSSCVSFYRNTLSKVEQKLSKDTTVVFLTVSIDKNQVAWKQSILSQRYSSPEIKNLYTKGNGSNSDVIKYYQIHSYPQPILIGKDQLIKVFSESLRSENDIYREINKVR